MTNQQGPRPMLQVLSPEGIEAVHRATLDILERIGVWIDEPEVLDLLDGAGARVSGPGWARLPAELVEQALASAPAHVELYGRDGAPAVALELDSYFGLAGDGPEFLDPGSGQRRSFCLSDARTMARLADALGSISFVELGGLAADVPLEVADRSVFRETVSNTAKPIGFCCGDSRALLDILDMAEVVAGGAEALRQRPFIWHHAEPVSPLRHSPEVLRRVLICAERQIPVGFMPMAEAGSTAPATLAGTLAQANAETLSGLVVHQSRCPGAPFILGGMPGIMDMRSLVVSYAAPELNLMSAAQCQMAHHYGLPFLTSAGASDAKDVDQQAAAEVALSCLTMAWAGANLVIDTAMLDHSELISPELAVLVDEVLGMVGHMRAGIPLNADDLALPVMAEAVTDGSYIAHAHTLRHFRDVWYPGLFDRSQKPDRAGHDLRRALRDRTGQIVAGHRPAPLSDPVARELDRMSRHWTGCQRGAGSGRR